MPTEPDSKGRGLVRGGDEKKQKVEIAKKGASYVVPSRVVSYRESLYEIGEIKV